MTSSVVGASSVPLNQTDDSGGLQEVLKDIKDTKKELGEVKQEIEKLNERIDAKKFKADKRYSSVDEVKAEKAALQNQLAGLQNQLAELQKKENILLQLQQQQPSSQQSSAGASMLPVRQEVCLIYKPVLHTVTHLAASECIVIFQSACSFACAYELLQMSNLAK